MSKVRRPGMVQARWDKHGAQSGPGLCDVPCRPSFAVEGRIEPFKAGTRLVGQRVEKPHERWLTLVQCSRRPCA